MSPNIPSNMRAAVVEAPGRLAIHEVPVPKPGDYEALCEVLFGSVCTGTDGHILAGRWNKPLPLILGHESVGRVIAVGEKVRSYRIGDVVTRVGAPAVPALNLDATWGGFADYGLAADHWSMARDGLPRETWEGKRVNQLVPAAIDLRTAPMFITWRETLSWLLRLGVALAGARVLVAGSGGNGIAFAAHAARLGARVTLLGAARWTERAKRAGVAVYVDHRGEEGTVAEALREAAPDGHALIIDTLGAAGLADRLLPHLASGGTLAVYGLDNYGGVRVSPHLARGPFRLQHLGDYDEAETHHAVTDAVLQGRLDASVWYDLKAPKELEELPEVFARLAERATPKVLVRLRG